MDSFGKPVAKSGWSAPASTATGTEPRDSSKGRKLSSKIEAGVRATDADKLADEAAASDPTANRGAEGEANAANAAIDGEEEVGGGGGEEGEEEEEEEEEELESEDMSNSSELTASEDETTWITWFCSLKGNNFFCKIDEDYIQDDFNLTGLSALVPYYEYALDMMLDVDIPIDNLGEEQQEMIETAAEVLYGLIHARFILTSRGMQRMYEKYFNVNFGRCPRVYCQGQNVLPVGLSDTPRNFSVNVFCPRCQELYYPRSSKHANLDGAYFGTTFPHLFLLAHPELIPPKLQQAYVPRIYGFRISKESVYYQPRETTSSSKRRSGGGQSGSSTKQLTSGGNGNGQGGDAFMNIQNGRLPERDRMRRRK